VQPDINADWLNFVEAVAEKTYAINISTKNHESRLAFLLKSFIS
jgi:hypothetical protein